MSPSSYGLTIVGGGPAGIAVLLAAHRSGLLDNLLAEGVALVEQTGTLGAGDLGRYAINSDSTGRTFVDCLEGPHASPLRALRSHPLAREIALAGDGPVPLALAGRFLSLVGETLRDILEAHPRCTVLTGHKALSARRDLDKWEVRLAGPGGTPTVVVARHLVSATGAHQPGARLRTERVGGTPLASCSDRLLQSGDVLASGGLDVVAGRLRGKVAPRVAIVGGSTSAVSVAHALLHRLPKIRFAADAVTLLHRRPLRITYNSAAEALADGYCEFGPDDVCPISGRVFRLAGFRLNQRELIMQARGIGGRPPEPRLRLHRLVEEGADGQARAILERADLVVAALGYRPHALRLFDHLGQPIPLLAGTGPGARLVDRQCRLLDATGTPIDGAFGIGLAAGFVPDGKLGGERSFAGQANGLWLWQNDVGRLIVDAVLGAEPAERDAELAPLGLGAALAARAVPQRVVAP